ncbi:MAG: hypothetical protein HGA36_01960 [Candidatus Moranbacteria bacterium]|nr:hypothetical protein [Candidatus Moranbacteria bacterium]
MDNKNKLKISPEIIITVAGLCIGLIAFILMLNRKKVREKVNKIRNAFKEDVTEHAGSQ